VAKILLVDDDAAVRKTLKMLLQEAGHDIDEAVDGNDAIARYEEHLAHDLIITDVFMPGRSGVQLILDLKRRHPDLKIIAISGGGAEKDLTQLQAAGALGADHIISKPISAEHLFDFVDDCLASSNHDEQ
jgi:CheY-like chemotaxis protein